MDADGIALIPGFFVHTIECGRSIRCSEQWMKPCHLMKPLTHYSPTGSLLSANSEWSKVLVF
ncbi:hypothetical protein SERLA73DRAFT_177274 [Serpula lacrymans var. lacrymans S7.3]|uniref:Uncharacterized protein n=2 Tax=Serpula lacrymans var. lacrymans TaxID=341189 RepID=F8PNQ1_SERL3|nr:uncharacterized protein SERLADRAFT_460782 [Serpula lacrymans var. lacrymans S7.9]EGO01778.1 hypothetical protein SERLA73DRAFT_177274 [Serpula lacrymans var. lacrymans S7.3]EGO27412.1 hypothetical protein SERLADRAFT_460782 [Serpula lacrymans var. lacrymans S7.9]